MKVHDLFHTCFQTYLGEGMLQFVISRFCSPFSLSLSEVNYVEAKSRQPRDKGAHLSEDLDILTLKDSLKCSASKALKRVCK